MNPNPDFVPATILEAVEHIVENLDDADRAHILYSGPEGSHFRGGMRLRNDWSLWEKDTPLKRDAIGTYGIAHADDISALIFAWVWAKVRGEAFDPVAYCERFHAHWRKHGTDSLRAGGIE